MQVFLLVVQFENTVLQGVCSSWDEVNKQVYLFLCDWKVELESCSIEVTVYNVDNRVGDYEDVWYYDSSSEKFVLCKWPGNG